MCDGKVIFIDNDIDAGDPTQPGAHTARFIANTGVGSPMEPGWARSLYVGAPVLLLALAARRWSLLAHGAK